MRPRPLTKTGGPRDGRGGSQPGCYSLIAVVEREFCQSAGRWLKISRGVAMGQRSAAVGDLVGARRNGLGSVKRRLEQRMSNNGYRMFSAIEHELRERGRGRSNRRCSGGYSASLAMTASSQPQAWRRANQEYARAHAQPGCQARQRSAASPAERRLTAGSSHSSSQRLLGRARIF